MSFELFVGLAHLATRSGVTRPALLKDLYLSLPYSEKGLRIHLRRLEMGAWVRFESMESDSRVRVLHLTEKYWPMLAVYLHACKAVIAQGPLQGDALAVLPNEVWTSVSQASNEALM